MGGVWGVGVGGGGRRVRGRSQRWREHFSTRAETGGMGQGRADNVQMQFSYTNPQWACQPTAGFAVSLVARMPPCLCSSSCGAASLLGGVLGLSYVAFEGVAVAARLLHGCFAEIRVFLLRRADRCERLALRPLIAWAC